MSPTIVLAPESVSTAYRIKTLKAWLAKWDRWSAACDAYTLKKGPAPDLRKMPSKNSKYKAYEAAHWLAPSFHCSTVADLRLVLAAVTA